MAPSSETLALPPFPTPAPARAAAGEVPEIWSVRFSVLGAALAVPALAALLGPSIAARSPLHVLSFSVYGLGVLAMFLSSAIYHARAGQERVFAKCLDYGAIGLMIAGCFTPFCAIAIATPVAHRVLALVWAMAVVALALRVTRTDMSKWVFVALFLAMGNLGLLLIPALWRALGPAGFGLTALGGAIYTTGTLFFNRYQGDVEPPGFGPHDVWHLFIIAAAATHWLVLYLYMRP